MQVALCKKCKKPVFSASFGNWRIGFCNCEIVIANIKTRAVLRTDYEDSKEIIDVVRELKKSLYKARREMDKHIKLFPESTYRNDEGEKQFYDIEKVVHSKP